MRSLTTRIESMWYSGKGSLWLAPLSFLYGVLMGIRSLLYRMGMRHRVRMKVPVIVVGNLTVGGTGKTPLVAWLSTHLSAVGLRVAIVSRSLTPDREPCNAPPAYSADLNSDTYPVRWARGPDAPLGRPIDVRTTADWQCYRYRVYETTVPLRNMLWRQE